MKKKKKRNRKTPIQHTKLVINFVLFMSFLMGVAVVIVGIHTSTPINDVAIEWIKCVAIILSSGMLKSYFETKSQKLVELEYLKAGFGDKCNNDFENNYNNVDGFENIEGNENNII